MFKYIEKYVIRRGRWMGTRIGVLLIGKWLEKKYFLGKFLG